MTRNIVIAGASGFIGRYLAREFRAAGDSVTLIGRTGPDARWGESVKAVVVLKPGQTATEQDIIQQARKYLAGYQKPRSVDFVSELPKAATGKILKRELRTPYWAEQERHV